MGANPDHARQLLEALERESALTQREIAASLKIALGSANQLLRELAIRQWVHRVNGVGRSVRYIVTPEGREALARMTRDNFRRALHSYQAIHARVRGALAACQAQPRHGEGQTAAVVMYGTTEVAHIAFACAADLGVTLVGFVDDEPRPSFLGLPVRTPGDVRAMRLDGRPFDWLLVTSLDDDGGIRGRLAAAQFPLERVTWI